MDHFIYKPNKKINLALTVRCRRGLGLATTTGAVLQPQSGWTTSMSRWWSSLAEHVLPAGTAQPHNGAVWLSGWVGLARI
jgi:hypothetical protein